MVREAGGDGRDGEALVVRVAVGSAAEGDETVAEQRARCQGEDDDRGSGQALSDGGVRAHVGFSSLKDSESLIQNSQWIGPQSM